MSFRYPQASDGIYSCLWDPGCIHVSLTGLCWHVSREYWFSFVLQSEQRFKFTYPQASDSIRLWDMVRISPLILASVADMLGGSFMFNNLEYPLTSVMSCQWDRTC